MQVLLLSVLLWYRRKGSGQDVHCVDAVPLQVKQELWHEHVAACEKTPSGAGTHLLDGWQLAMPESTVGQSETHVLTSSKRLVKFVLEAGQLRHSSLPGPEQVAQVAWHASQRPDAVSGKKPDGHVLTHVPAGPT
jgi:hypothetical protein